MGVSLGGLARRQLWASWTQQNPGEGTNISLSSPLKCLSVPRLQPRWKTFYFYFLCSHCSPASGCSQPSHRFPALRVPLHSRDPGHTWWGHHVFRGLQNNTFTRQISHCWPRFKGSSYDNQLFFSYQRLDLYCRWQKIQLKFTST